MTNLRVFLDGRRGEHWSGSLQFWSLSLTLARPILKTPFSTR